MHTNTAGNLVLYKKCAAPPVHSKVDGKEDKVHQPPREHEAGEEGVESAAEDAALGGFAVIVVPVDAALRAGADLEEAGQQADDELWDG